LELHKFGYGLLHTIKVKLKREKENLVSAKIILLLYNLPLQLGKQFPTVGCTQIATTIIKQALIYSRTSRKT
jgi:hypothetical protein